MTTEPTVPRSKRLHALDNLRTVLVYAVVLGHALMPHATLRDEFVDPVRHVSVDWLFLWGYGWVVPGLVLLVGYFAGDLVSASAGAGPWATGSGACSFRSCSSTPSSLR